MSLTLSSVTLRKNTRPHPPFYSTFRHETSLFPTHLPNGAVASVHGLPSINFPDASVLTDMFKIPGVA